MAIDYHDLTAINDTLKNAYGEGLANQFQDEHMTYNMFPKSDRKPRGNGYVFGIRYERAQGVGARAESDKRQGVGPWRTVGRAVLRNRVGRSGPFSDSDANQGRGRRVSSKGLFERLGF